MVRRFLLTLVFLALFPIPAWAATFTASVESPQVSVNRPFELQLSLSGASAKSPPDLSPLNGQFQILGQMQTSNYNFINGAMSASSGVQLTLLPRRQGRLTIPELSVETEDGILKTQAIQIEATQTGGMQPPAASDQPVTLGAAADPLDPYQGQPVRYEIDVIAGTSLMDLVLDDLPIEDAIVDKPAKPNIRDDVRNGSPVKIIQYNFTITPLKPGRLVIPAPSIHGTELGMANVPTPLEGQYFGLEKFLDAFKNIGSHPIALTGNTVVLNVRPPPVQMNPWLPLYSMEIRDEWKGIEHAKAGEPVTRKITQLAEGITGNQLPNLEENQNHNDFKVYADKAETGTNNGHPGERVVGWRHESYTLIPQKAGSLTFPAIRVPWWNVATNKIDYADLPARTIEVAPAAQTSTPAPQPVPPPTAQAEQPQEASPPPEPVKPAMTESEKILYGVIGVLIFVLCLLIAGVVHMSGKVKATRQPPPAKMPAAAKAPAVSMDEELKKARTPDELRRCIQKFAASRWGCSANTSLEKIATFAPTPLRADFEHAVKNLTAALYAKHNVDLTAMKNDLAKIFAWKMPKTDTKKPGAKLQDLNPN